MMAVAAVFVGTIENMLLVVVLLKLYSMRMMYVKQYQKSYSNQLY